ncbi:MAG TPA: type II toxin-antitoxin system VapC family toxin [Bryobacteraceae bacterium]|nr:type II toxin-antitoxin system VapC family toxin [Bryobacteraceae bacterium]
MDYSVAAKWLLPKPGRDMAMRLLEAQKAFRLMEKCAPRLFDMRIGLHRALDLALQYQLSLWGCIYLELAIEHECPFITSDLRLFRGSAARHPLIRLLS